ncbi:flavin monoamine oxidase family protein [Rhodohalobacter sp.]|uniref:flavin monoamine oxidase family protein n=1 Tax=Rhodohalobacter sp. TaxID=1974210 RepID=UPI002ACDEC7A|nr:FAD-dependent oxidoreductase [Rhodohalobacter sp.]MDZ7756931.1 FAD-dependent oxidoreductase [Rhodohalobacter sp.]
MNKKVIIIGGGLAGLTAAYLLEKKKIYPTILEARNRLGGRIHTIRPDKNKRVEMGATWLGKQHHSLIQLIRDLGLDLEEQHLGDKAFYEYISTSPAQLVQLPPNEDPTWRIKGGSDRLIEALQEKLTDTKIYTGQVVKKIKNGEKVEVQTASKSYLADAVITTLPPKLLSDRIEFTPALPGKLLQIADQTHTWMGESIKVGLFYEDPFWMESDSSGTIMSNVGPVNEMYDHSDSEKSSFALKGFLNGAYHSVNREERKKVVLNQLRKYYGEKAGDYTLYQDTVWQNESFTYSEYQKPVVPHQHNGDDIFTQPYWDGKLLLAGAETSQISPGYMDGAVESAKRVAEMI